MTRLLRLTMIGIVGSLQLATACLEDPGSGPDTWAPSECTADDVVVMAMLVRDAREAPARDSALVNLGLAPGGELPSACDATVVLVAGSVRTTLQPTQPGQYEAGYSELVAGLPPLTLVPGAEHELQIDLGSDGSVDVTGIVTLSAVDNFRTTWATSSEVAFAWDDAGVATSTTYYVQASDQRDFDFPDNFASGYAEGVTSLEFGGASAWPYFSATSPCFARIQAETAGSVTTEGRFSAWEWPVEPILEY